MPSINMYISVIFCLLVYTTADNIKDASEKNPFPNDFGLVGSYRRSHALHGQHHHDHQGEFPPNFQHSPEYHRGDLNFMSTPTNRGKHSPTRDEDDVDYSNATLKYIPVDFINIINQYNVSDLLLNYIDDDEDPLIESRFGDGSERSESVKDAATIPKAAGCSPEIQTVQLKNSSDPSVLYIPQCTKVERCSGCCSHPLLSCQPTKTETLTYQVLKTQYNGAKKLKLLGKEVILLEKHLACKCDCKIKEESCNSYQEYHASECRCVCTNTDEEKKCYKNYTKKLWNPDLCACQCRDVFQCSTGQYFDNHECKCMSTPVRRRYAISETADAPPVIDDGDF